MTSYADPTRWGVVLCLAAVAVCAGPWEELFAAYPERGFSHDWIDSLKHLHQVSSSSTAPPPPPPLVRRTSERLVYEAGWGFVKAGYAELTFASDSTSGRAWSSFRGVTNRFVSTFYRVHNFIQSTMHFDTMLPLFFEEHVNEGRYSARRWVLFDHDRLTAFTNQRHEEKQICEIRPREHDLLSMVQAVRSRQLVPRTSFTLPCFVQGTRYDVKFDVHNRERITVEAGTFSCIVVEPHLAGEGRTFSRRDRIQIWFTDDDHRIPVRVRSRIAIGSVVGELVDYRRE